MTFLFVCSYPLGSTPTPTWIFVLTFSTESFGSTVTAQKKRWFAVTTFTVQLEGAMAWMGSILTE